MLMEMQITAVANEVLDYDMEKCSLGDNSEFDYNYTQTVIPRTHN
jgi:hypothetical protein